MGYADNYLCGANTVVAILSDWQISMPDDWQGEYDKDSGQCVFYS